MDRMDHLMAEKSDKHTFKVKSVSHKKFFNKYDGACTTCGHAHKTHCFFVTDRSFEITKRAVAQTPQVSFFIGL